MLVQANVATPSGSCCNQVLYGAYVAESMIHGILTGFVIIMLYLKDLKAMYMVLLLFYHHNILVREIRLGDSG